MKTKRILSVFLTASLVLSLTSCGNGSEKDEDSVKVPESIKIESSVTYEEAIADLKYDQKTAYILSWVEDIHQDIMLLTQPMTVQETSGLVISNTIEDEKTGERKINTKVTNECLRNLETAFKAEPDYTEYMSKIPFAQLRETYIKYISCAKEMQQKYAETGPTFDLEYSDLTVDENYAKFSEYYLRLNNYYLYFSKNMDAEDYFKLSIYSVYESLRNLESFCVYNKDISSEEAEESSAQQRLPSDRLYGAPSYYDVDFELSQLEIAMSQKNNLNAIANKYFGNDEIAIKAYDDFMKEVNRLYEIVRLHRPENGTDYTQKYDYNLDRLDELLDKLV